jgi:hypothetical protein
MSDYGLPTVMKQDISTNQNERIREGLLAYVISNSSSPLNWSVSYSLDVCNYTSSSNLSPKA